MRPMSEAPRDDQTYILVKTAALELYLMVRRVAAGVEAWTNHPRQNVGGWQPRELLGWWYIEELVADHERLNQIEAYPYRINLAYDPTTPKDTGLPTLRQQIDWFFGGDK